MLQHLAINHTAEVWRYFRSWLHTMNPALDHGRRTGHATGRFLILGSASIDLLRQSGESVAGRIAYIDMGPFYTLELPVDESSVLRLWLRGGFPGSYLAEDDSVSLRWRIDSYRFIRKQKYFNKFRQLRAIG